MVFALCLIGFAYAQKTAVRICPVGDHYSLFPHEQCPAGRVFQYRVGSGRVLDKIPGSGSGSGRVGVSKNMIGYFRVSFFLSGISGYFG